MAVAPRVSHSRNFLLKSVRNSFIFSLTIRLFFANIMGAAAGVSVCGIRLLGGLIWGSSPDVAGIDPGTSPGMNRVSPLDLGLTAFLIGSWFLVFGS